MKRKIVVKILIGVASTFAVLLVVLVIHIYMAIDKKSENMLQLSRIDFKEAMSEAEYRKVKSFVASLDGVEAVLYNADNGTLVYTYTLSKQNSKNVYDQLMKIGNYKAVRYQVSAETAQNGCPAGMDQGFAGKLTSFIGQFK